MAAKTGTYTLIASSAPAALTTTVTFSSIPATYTDLVLVANVTNYNASVEDCDVRFNSDTGTNYSWTRIEGDGSVTGSGRGTSTTSIPLALAASGSGGGVAIWNIQDYANATTYKTALYRNNLPATKVQAYVGLWRSTAAISTITLTKGGNGFAAGCTFKLYGIEAGNQ